MSRLRDIIRLSLDWPIMCCGKRPCGRVWFRIFGWGLSLKNADKYGLDFVERCQFVTYLRIGPYIVRGIAP